MRGLHGAQRMRTIWSASMSTVLTENFRLQKLKRSSKLGPSRSMTMTLYSPSTPYHRRLGMPAGRIRPISRRERWIRTLLLTSPLQDPIELRFIEELRMPGLDRLLRARMRRIRTRVRSQTRCMPRTSLTPTSSPLFALVPARTARSCKASQPDASPPRMRAPRKISPNEPDPSFLCVFQADERLWANGRSRASPPQPVFPRDDDVRAHRGAGGHRLLIRRSVRVDASSSNSCNSASIVPAAWEGAKYGRWLKIFGTISLSFPCACYSSCR